MFLLYAPKQFVIWNIIVLRFSGENLKAKAPPEETLKVKAINFLVIKHRPNLTVGNSKTTKAKSERSGTIILVP